MQSTLPFPSHFSSADSYISSLTAFTSTPFFRQLVGGVHILDFFTSSPPLYDTLLPLDWREYFDTQSIEEVLELFLRTDLTCTRPDGLPDSLYEFARDVQRHELCREFVQGPTAASGGGGAEAKHKLNRQRRLAAGMSDKKLHEVEHFARYLSTLLGSLASDTSKAGDSITHLVDFGSGQSYLSRILASPPHSLDIVAVESKTNNIEAGKALDARVGLGPISQGKSLKESMSNEDKKGSIKYVQHMINDESMKKVLNALDESSDGQTSEQKTQDLGLMIISLHSCGNLIHHALNSLLANDEVKAVAVVDRFGPTYKPPYQKYAPTPLAPTPSSCLNHHFPLSTRLTSLSASLNITTRMMACQAPRNWTPTTSADFFKRHFYRALLQRIFFDRGVLSATEPLIIGSLKKSAYGGFEDYVAAAVQKILAASTEVCAGSGVAEGVKERIVSSGLGGEGRNDEVAVVAREYERQHGNGLKQLSVLWTLMAICGGCVESLIVVDRWCYLLESGKCKVVKVESAFEYAVSPRNLVVVGVK
ncbi:hypothetical protein ABW20_dc0104290 [Dactylellina cionopaga]|nr:hypothetical protein ABW20_dc0104290 [Dactylellina cionopaga]